jgi:histo-blood group ABO system transferase
MKIVNTIENEILAENVSVLHPGFYNKDQKEFPYETNKKSLAYVEKDQGKKYYQGCFQGGTLDNYLKMCEILNKNIIKDLNNNFIANWWDESHLNRYKIDNPPTLELLPDYAMPEEWVGIKKEKIITLDEVHTPVFDDSGNFIRDDYNYVENISYNINYESQKPKIIHLLKDHIEIRGIV